MRIVKTDIDIEDNIKNSSNSSNSSIKNNNAAGVRYRLVASALTLTVTLMCTAAALLIPLQTTVVKVAGAFASVFVVSAAAWAFPKRFYALALIFDVFAAGFGSVLNLYKYFDPYDKFVHFMSGVLLAAGGRYILSYILKKRKVSEDKVISMIFSFLFSAACAAFWEIYEYTADSLLGISMQGGNANTMGDIVSGVLGGAAYVLVCATASKYSKDR